MSAMAPPGAPPEPWGAMAQFDEPTCSSKRHRGQCRVPRRPAARTRHKTGVVSRVPRGSRSAQAFGTDRNTYQTNLTPATKYGHPRATDRKELTTQKDNGRNTLTLSRSGYPGALASVVILLVQAGDASPCPFASHSELRLIAVPRRGRYWQSAQVLTVAPVGSPAGSCASRCVVQTFPFSMGTLGTLGTPRQH